MWVSARLGPELITKHFFVTIFKGVNLEFQRKPVTVFRLQTPEHVYSL